jgi:uncharacterized protein (TIGR02145 family)
MKYFRPLILFFLLTSIACEKQEIDEQLYYFVETLPASFSEGEMTYNGRFFTGKDSLVEYGFMLLYSNYNLQRVLVADKNQSGYFSVKDSISVYNHMSRFVQAYAVSENYLNFGEVVKLEKHIINYPVEGFHAFPVSNITLSNATISARHNMIGAVEEMGVVLSAKPSPSYDDYQIKGKLYEDVFSDYVPTYHNRKVYVHRFRGLEPATTYYAKTYLKYGGTIHYSGELVFTTLDVILRNGNGVTDIDGNHYETVQINNQEWMAENLKVTHFNNGDSITSGNNAEDWKMKTSPLYAVFDHDMLDGLNNEEEVKSAFGLLYNGYAIKDSRQLCPEGWRLTTKNDWQGLFDYSNEHLGYYINDPELHYYSEAYIFTSCRNPETTIQACQTNVAPFWYELKFPEEPYDIFGLAINATGYRYRYGGYDENPRNARFWLADPYDSLNHYTLSINPVSKTGFLANWHGTGSSVRCIRDLEN